MYFIPQKNRWYSTFAYISPGYRYTGLFLIIALILLVWRYGLYTWLDAAIQHEQGVIAQFENQLQAQGHMQREHDELMRNLPLLNNACSTAGQCCIGQECYDQCSYLFNEAKRSGLRITDYQNAQEKSNQIRKCQQVSIGVAGSFDQLQQFLQQLKSSARMIQCTGVSAQEEQSGALNARCTIQFIWPNIEKN